MGASLDRKLFALFSVLGACLVMSMIPGLGVAAQLPQSGSVVLGNVSGPYQDGYGEAHPRKIFGGGDPTGLVQGVHWKHWGSGRATGWGTGLFVWPGRTVAEGVRARARVVAFRLGSCEGHAAYNALEWFFPAYHQRFHPSLGGQICTEHHHHQFPFHSRHCGGVQITRLTRATELTSENMTCRSARRLIRTSQTQRFAVAGGRFRHHGFYCGSMGWGEIGPPSIFECALDDRSVVFDVNVPA
jgi:hypothetical protein